MQTHTSKPRTISVQKIDFDPATRSLNDLLALAERHGSQGNLRQAEDMFWMLADDYSEAPQAEVAKDRLRALAHEFERDGNPHEAHAIYERLIPGVLDGDTWST